MVTLTEKMTSISEELGYKTLLHQDEYFADFDRHRLSADSQDSAAQTLQKWLALLPKEITNQIERARQHAVPFMPPDVTPELLSSRNASMPMDQIQIVCRCLDMAMSCKDYDTAAALVFVVDRALYRFGRAKPLLRLVSEIQRASPDTAMAPQVILRQARVMKDEGDLNGAMRILYHIINKECKWPYQSEQQYADTKAACLHVEGQIYHNLELWREAVRPLVEAVRIFRQVQDEKGVSSCLTVLSRCLPRLDHNDYENIRRTYPDVFKSSHPCYEGYLQGVDAVRFVDHIEARFFAAKHQLVADESLLMFAEQQPPENKQALLHTILNEVKKSLAGHKAVQFLNNVEAFVEFVRGVFMVSQVLYCSRFSDDRNASRYFEKLAMELYQFMCCRMEGEKTSQPTASLKHTGYSVSLMNRTLGLIGLPPLQGSEDIFNEKGREERLLTDEIAVFRVSSSQQPESSEREDVAEEKLDCQATNMTPHSAQDERLLRNVDSSSPPYDTCSSSALNVDNYPEEKSRYPAKKSHTFPAAPPQKPQPQYEPRAKGHTLKKFVGLPMTSEELRASTCPAFSPEAWESLSVEADQLEVAEEDLEALSVSGRTMLSTHGQGAPSGLATDLGLLFHVTKSETPDNPLQGSAERLPTKDPSLSSCGVKSTEANTGEFLQKAEYGTVDRDAATAEYGMVDQDATTKSSNPFSSGSSASAPLVDLTAPSSKGFMEDMNMGECNVETEDPQEFLANWTPSADTGVHEAVLMTYNPDTGKWSSQTTLARLGSQLQTDRKGAFRDAYHISLLHQDEPLGRYVGKRYRQQRRPLDYLRDVECQMLAGYLVTRFNQQLKAAPKEFLGAQFLPAFHLRLLNELDKTFNWINVEPYLHGSFRKLTSNHRYVYQKGDLEDGVEVATAFSHFTFVESSGECMVVDLQGWVPSSDRGFIYLTDPVFHTKGNRAFCSGDRHEEGMKEFWQHVHPTCNRICHFLSLDKRRPEGAGV